MSAILLGSQHVNSFAPEWCGSNFTCVFLKLILWIDILSYSCEILVKFSGECHRTPVMINQHRFRYWLGAVRQQAITWTTVDPDLCHHKASLGHNELTSHNWSLTSQVILFMGYLPGTYTSLLTITLQYKNQYHFNSCHCLHDHWLYGMEPLIK